MDFLPPFAKSRSSPSDSTTSSRECRSTGSFITLFTDLLQTVFETLADYLGDEEDDEEDDLEDLDKTLER